MCSVTKLQDTECTRLTPASTHIVIAQGLTRRLGKNLLKYRRFSSSLERKPVREAESGEKLVLRLDDGAVRGITDQPLVADTGK